MPLSTPLFAAGIIVTTPGAQEALFSIEVLADLLQRHLSGDWGDLSAGDKAANDQAVSRGDERILSAYKTTDGTKIWIITEWDRSVTTLLLPEEY